MSATSWQNGTYEEVWLRGDKWKPRGSWRPSKKHTVVDGKICNNSSHSVQHRYCGIRSTLGTPTGQLLHHAISSGFRIHFFDATLICLAFADVSAVYLASRRAFPPRGIIVSRGPRTRTRGVRGSIEIKYAGYPGKVDGVHRGTRKLSLSYWLFDKRRSLLNISALSIFLYDIIITITRLLRNNYWLAVIRDVGFVIEIKFL